MTDEAVAVAQPLDGSADAEMAAVGVYVGQILAGKYRVDRVLGLGGMGIVVKATHTILNTDVAVKFLLPEFVNDQRIASRFLREAKAVVAIKNSHVASVIDVGTLDSGSPYIVMEYLQGRDLEDVIQVEGCISDFDRAGRLLIQACEGLAAAHATGIVHRDIKPGNLFLTRASDGTEQVKVLDFGISKNDQELSGLTQTGTIMGSPMYMSPEQMRSTRNVDERTDIWSLGVVAFQMLTGRLPYEAESMTELVAMVIEYEPPRVSSIRPDVPEIFDAIIAQALAKKVAERYPSVGHLANDLAIMLGDPVSQETAARTQRILANSDRSQSFKLETPGTVTRPGMGVSVIRQRTGSSMGLAATATSSSLGNTGAGVAAAGAPSASKAPVLVVGGLLALVLAIGGGYWFSQSQRAASDAADAASAGASASAASAGQGTAAVGAPPTSIPAAAPAAAPSAPPAAAAAATATATGTLPAPASDTAEAARSSESGRTTRVRPSGASATASATAPATAPAMEAPSPVRQPAVDPFSDRN